jgi:nucleotide-binding universal stress UspA family protein
MSERDDERAIRRILVALDASLHSLAALEAAAELAATLEAELHGLFVEDAGLLRLAGLPVAREMRYPFVAPARLDRARMERELRAQAAQARRALAAACEQRQVKWSFRVVRGEVAPEVLAAAREADLLSLGKASRPLIRRVHMGSTARTAAARCSRSVLLLQRDRTIRPPVVVLYDGSESSLRALMMAARLARRKGGYLTVLVLADTADVARRLQTRVSDLLRGQGLTVRYRQLPGGGLATLTDAVESEGSGALVLSRMMLALETLEALLDQVDCPVLLVC